MLAGGLWPAMVSGQAFTISPHTVSDTVRELLARESKNLVASAELMPVDQYGYHPTPAQMTFGELIVHIAQTNMALCSGISGTPSPLSVDQLGKLSAADGKVSLVATLKQSFDYCTEALAKVDDSALALEVSIFGRPSHQARGAMMIVIATDWADHYSTAASYLRLNGILPPTADPKKQPH
jgi:hypothetical protein